MNMTVIVMMMNCQMEHSLDDENVVVAVVADNDDDVKTLSTYY